MPNVEVTSMNRICVLCAASTFAAFCTVGVAQSSNSLQNRVTETAAKQMLRHAHTPAEYRAVSEYDRALCADYEKMASKEETDWSYQMTVYPYQKNLSPASPRNLYMYYKSKAAKMCKLSRDTDRMATSLLTSTAK